MVVGRVSGWPELWWVVGIGGLGILGVGEGVALVLMGSRDGWLGGFREGEEVVVGGRYVA